MVRVVVGVAGSLVEVGVVLGIGARVEVATTLLGTDVVGFVPGVGTTVTPEFVGLGACIVGRGIEDTGPRFISLPPLGDTTGKVANALLRPEEDTRGHLLQMAGIIRLFGIPWPYTVNATGSSGCMTRPGNAPQQAASTRARRGPVAWPEGRRAARNQLHGKCAISPRIQLRKTYVSILSPYRVAFRQGMAILHAKFRRSKGSPS